MNITCSCCRHDNAPWRKHCGSCAGPLRRTAWQLKQNRGGTTPIDIIVTVIDTPAR